MFEDRNRYESASDKGIASFGSDSGLARPACETENRQRTGTDFRATGQLDREEWRGIGVHSTRQARTEFVHWAVQLDLPGRGPGLLPVQAPY